MSINILAAPNEALIHIFSSADIRMVIVLDFILLLSLNETLAFACIYYILLKLLLAFRIDFFGVNFLLLLLFSFDAL